jgi:dTDP-4-dehydrorhamnose 3,5-epimerase-like enzyme
MEPDALSVVELPDFGDLRGRSFSVPAELLAEPFPVADSHIATIEPGAVRGNHCHAVLREILLVMPSDRWSVHWDTGAGTEVQRMELDGKCAAAVLIPRNWSHAIRNDGDKTMWMAGLTDRPFDPENRDAIPRVVVDPEPA